MPKSPKTCRACGDLRESWISERSELSEAAEAELAAFAQLESARTEQERQERTLRWVLRCRRTQEVYRELSLQWRAEDGACGCAPQSGAQRDELFTLLPERADEQGPELLLELSSRLRPVLAGLFGRLGAQLAAEPEEAWALLSAAALVVLSRYADQPDLAAAFGEIELEIAAILQPRCRRKAAKRGARRAAPVQARLPGLDLLAAG
jgi:hypothetical protein